MISRLLILTLGLGVAGGVSAARGRVQSAPAETERVIVIQAYKDGLAGVRAANPDVHLNVGRDPTAPDGPVLFVEYPAPTDDPAARDVRCDAENEDWTAGRAISFRIKPDHPVRLSLSFFDRNRVAYVKGIAFAPHDRTSGRLAIGRFVVSQ